MGFIKRQIDLADYYIVIIAGWYGSIGSEGLSYTEMEYDYARPVGKSMLAFIHADPGKIPNERSEQDPERRKRLESFKQKARRAIVSLYSNPHELAMQVMASLVDLKDRKPAVGYIRADQTIDVRRYADILEENQELKDTISKLQSTSSVFHGAYESLSLNITIVDEDNKGKPIESINRSVVSSLSLGRIFIAVAEAIIDAKTTDHQIERAILKTIPEGNPEATSDRRYFKDVEIFTLIRRTLFGARLIELQAITTGERLFRRTYNLWSLTEFGQAQYRVLMGS